MPIKDMLSPDYPMIAPKHFREHTPESWHSFVKSLKIEPEAKEETSIRLKRLKKGNLSVTLPRTRKPPWVFQTELETLAREAGEQISEVYLVAKSKGILIIKERKEKQTKTEKKDDKKTKGSMAKL